MSGLYPSETLYPSESLYPAEDETGRISIAEPPPMRQYLLATTPGGKTYRWGEDEMGAERVIEGLTDSDTVPGGYKELTGALARKPGVDYSDMQRGTTVALYGAGGRLIWEGRLERAPRTSGDYLVMDPVAVGYQSELTDREDAQGIFIDCDLTAWGEPSTERKTTYPLQKFNTDGQVQVLPAGDPKGSAVASLSHSFAQINNNEGKEIDIAESWYLSPVELGRIMLDFVTVKGMGAGWHNGVYASSDAINTELLHDYEGTASTERLSQEIPAGRFYLLLGDYYAPTSAGAVNSEAQWRNVKVLGRHGLTLYGTWPEVGLLASDVIAYLLPLYAPTLGFTTGAYGSLRPTTFPIPQLAFKEPTTLKDMIEQSLRFELREWGVWGARTFCLNPRGEREGRKRWRTRVRPAKLTETGQQMDQLWNKVVVTYTEPGGVQRTVGPLNSGYPVTSARLEDTDPQNPLNEAGIVRTKRLTLNSPADGPEGAYEAGERFLEQANLLDGSGQATLSGYVEDADSGAMYPYDAVHAGDLIEFLDASVTGYRYIVEANRSRSERATNISIDAPPDSYSALMERIGARESAAGIA